LEAERSFNLRQPFLQAHERESEVLDLVIRQSAALHSADCLVLEHLSQKLEQRVHELRQTRLDDVRLRIDALRQCGRDLAQLRREEREVVRADARRAFLAHAANEYGGQGPLVRKRSSGSAARAAAMLRV